MSEDSPDIKPKRRPRYRGTHPRKFSEKYKELAPEKYADDVEKIKLRGVTPVGTHRPICVDEILQIFQLRPGATVLDATLGYGGHSQEILKHILPGGHLFALDQDKDEREKTKARLLHFLREQSQPEEALIIGPINFCDARSFLRQSGHVSVDCVLADLGISSMQIDDPQRGFSYKIEAPFDLRMNRSQGEPAWMVLSQLSAQEIEDLLRDLADEPHARQIAAALVKAKPQTTTDVAKAVSVVMTKMSKNIRDKEGDTPIRRVFQAFRIYVNREYEVLDQLLSDLPQILKPRGKVAILSFHSGEDRRVKKAFQAGYRDGLYEEISQDLIRPSAPEQFANPRSRSAKLRWATRAP